MHPLKPTLVLFALPMFMAIANKPAGAVPSVELQAELVAQLHAYIGQRCCASRCVGSSDHDSTFRPGSADPRDPDQDTN